MERKERKTKKKEGKEKVTTPNPKLLRLSLSLDVET